MHDTAQRHQSQQESPGRVDLAVKLLRYSLDPSASDGEAANAAQRFVEAARRERVTFDVLVGSLGKSLPPPSRKPVCRPWECGTVMPFGRHAGLTLGEIGTRHPAYLRWMARDVGDDELREAAGIVLYHLNAGRSV